MTNNCEEYQEFHYNASQKTWTKNTNSKKPKNNQIQIYYITTLRKTLPMILHLNILKSDDIGISLLSFSWLPDFSNTLKIQVSHRENLFLNVTFSIEKLIFIKILEGTTNAETKFQVILSISTFFPICVHCF